MMARRRLDAPIASALLTEVMVSTGCWSDKSNRPRYIVDLRPIIAILGGPSRTGMFFTITRQAGDNDRTASHSGKGVTPVSAAKAVSGIRSGDRVFIGGAACAPDGLIDALTARAPELHEV